MSLFLVSVATEVSELTDTFLNVLQPLVRGSVRILWCTWNTPIVYNSVLPLIYVFIEPQGQPGCKGRAFGYVHNPALAHGINILTPFM